MMVNEALHSIGHHNTDINLNRLLTQVIPSLTASFPFLCGVLNVSVAQFPHEFGALPMHSQSTSLSVLQAASLKSA